MSSQVVTCTLPRAEEQRDGAGRGQGSPGDQRCAQEAKGAGEGEGLWPRGESRQAALPVTSAPGRLPAWNATGSQVRGKRAVSPSLSEARGQQP